MSNWNGLLDGVQVGAQIGQHWRDRRDRSREIEQALKQRQAENTEAQARFQQQQDLTRQLENMRGWREDTREGNAQSRFEQQQALTRELDKHRGGREDVFHQDDVSYRNRALESETDYRNKTRTDARERDAADRQDRVRDIMLRLGQSQQELAAQQAARKPFSMTRVVEPTETGGMVTTDMPADEYRRQQAAKPPPPPIVDPQQAKLQIDLAGLQKDRAAGGEFPGPDILYAGGNLNPLTAGTNLATGGNRSDRIAQIMQQLGPIAQQAGGGAAAQPKEISSQQEYDALPSGTTFSFNGRKGRKP